MSAGVADLGQRVVLGAEADDQIAGAEGGGEGGVEAGDAPLDLEALALGQIGDLGRAAVLALGQFGLGVDAPGEAHQGVRVPLNG